MNTLEPISDRSRAVGLRIAFARGAAGLSQDDVSTQIGFSDRQTISAIETGERRVQPDELVKFSQVLSRPVEWFIDPFVVAGERNFSWRVSKKVSDEDLRTFEERTETWVGLLRFLRAATSPCLEPFTSTLQLDVKSSFEQATAMGEAVAKRLDLGSVPSQRLIDEIESRLDIPVLFFDDRPASGDISGAMCRMRDLRVILINRLEPAARRHFDVAHELFHALTWDAMAPKHRESSNPMSKKTGGKSARIERLADNFAAGLLMPRAVLDQLLDHDRLEDLTHLSEVAQVLEVSTISLAYRLRNAELINKETCEALRLQRGGDVNAPAPKRFSAPFVRLVHSGIDSGHVAARKVAIALGINFSQLADLFQEHDLSVPFAT